MPRTAPRHHARRAPRTAPPPIILPLLPCPVCGYDHPKPKGTASGSDSPFLTAPQFAGFLGIKTATLYSEKSRKHLLPTLPGRKSPTWDSCVAARFLYERRIGGATPNVK